MNIAGSKPQPSKGAKIGCGLFFALIFSLVAVVLILFALGSNHDSGKNNNTESIEEQQARMEKNSINHLSSKLNWDLKKINSINIDNYSEEINILSTSDLSDKSEKLDAVYRLGMIAFLNTPKKEREAIVEAKLDHIKNISLNKSYRIDTPKIDMLEGIATGAMLQAYFIDGSAGARIAFDWRQLNTALYREDPLRADENYAQILKEFQEN